MGDPSEAGTAYAGFWVRLWASLIDTVLLGAIVVPLLLAVYGPAYLTSPAFLKGPADFALSYLLPAAAVIVFWIYRSATPGKLVIGARIVDARTGGRPSTAQLVGRYFAYYLSLFPLGLGFFWVGLDRRKQGWHDKLAGTVVVRGGDAATPVAR